MTAQNAELLTFALSFCTFILDFLLFERICLGLAFGIRSLALVDIHLAQVGNTQRTELIAFDVRLHHDVVSAMKQRKTRGVINHYLLGLLIHSQAESPVLFDGRLVE